jgi:hypothetical protein
MPSSPQPIVGNLGPVWTPMLQAAMNQKQKAANLAAGKQQGGVWDQYQNCVELSGSNLDQIVTIGAGPLTGGGVQVSTGLANGTAGRCTRQNQVVASVHLTAGSTTATISSPSGTFAAGMVIGAATASGAEAITPGTTISSVSGSTVTLSQAAIASGSGLLCAAANFVMAEPGSWLALTVASPFTAASGGYFAPAARLVSGDTVQLSGAISNTTGTSYTNEVVALLPSAALIPTSKVQMAAGWSADTSGHLTVASIPAGSTVGLDGLFFRLF